MIGTRSKRICKWAIIICCLTGASQAQVWNPDLGNGRYQNPVIHTDYSDPDVCRVGDDYYLVASSFTYVPGLPILHSKDLVNWKLIGYALPKLVPEEHFKTTRPGDGVWAPVIRYHNGEFFIYYPDPDFGIYLVKARNIEGPWSEPVLVEAGKGLIDPCPLWDDDGKNYLVHAYANSRAGIKSILAIKELNAEGTKTVTEAVRVYDGHEMDPTVEGPKLYKRNGYYYIFAPAGGVKEGWQIALRAKNIYGPYERKMVMDQGSTIINGPHQGAWVDTESGEDWFLHFQDKGAYGRVVHLQPMKWVNDWPVIGNDTDGDGKGEPVLTHEKPDVGKLKKFTQLPENDEFKSSLNIAWQWPANPDSGWYSLEQSKKKLRLFTSGNAEASGFSSLPNLLTQKFPAEEFTVTVKVIVPTEPGELEAGMIITGKECFPLRLRMNSEGVFIWAPGYEIVKLKEGKKFVFLRARVAKGAILKFSYSLDGKTYFGTGHDFHAEPGRWVGARVGLFCTGIGSSAEKKGYVDFEYFRIEK